jgi:hypothetical protein
MSEHDTAPVLAYAQSSIMGLYINAEWGHCYENCYPALFAFPEVFHPHGLFIEGWIVFTDSGKVVLMEHGWLVRGIQLFDPTIVLVTMPDQPIAYFPGVTRTWPEMEALENELFPHVRFEDYGEDGMQHPGYKAAYEAAKAHALAMLTDGQELIEVKAGEPAIHIERDEEDAESAILIIMRKGDEPTTHTTRPD